MLNDPYKGNLPDTNISSVWFTAKLVPFCVRWRNMSTVGRLPLQYLRAVSGREKEIYKQREAIKIGSVHSCPMYNQREGPYIE